MPLYEYRCTACEKTVDIRHGFDETHAEPCPHCGGKLARAFGVGGIMFKGSGFYVNDSRGAKSSTAASTPPATPTDAASPAPAAPAAPATPAPAPSPASGTSSGGAA